MSSGFNTIRKHSSDPHALRFKELAAELAKSKNATNANDLESDDIRSQGRMDHSTVKLNDERLKFVYPINASLDNYYEFPFEPDFDKLKIWFMLDHLGTTIRDMSGFQHHGFLLGHPTMHRAPLNLGYLQTSASFGFPAMSFNTALDVVGNVTGEHIRVPDHADLRFSNFANGFSVCFRFSCVDFSIEESDDGTFNRRFASKLDDVNNHWAIVFDSTGDIDFQVTHNGILYKRDFDNLLPAPAWYQVMATYDPNAGATAADRIKIYVGGTEGSSESTLNLIPAPVTQKDLFIGARYAGNGFFRGFIQDFRIYMNKVLTPTECANLNSNEITIEDIPKGHVFIVQYALVWQQASTFKTHIYNVVNFASTTKTHKYHIAQQFTATRTHKYHVGLDPFSATKTHKYNIITSFTTTKTHKFNTIVSFTTTKTHKYHVTISDIPPVFYGHYDG